MVIIRQSIYIFSQSSQRKWVNWKHTAPHIVWWITESICLILLRCNYLSCLNLYKWKMPLTCFCLDNGLYNHYMDVTWMSWRFSSPATRMFFSTVCLRKHKKNPMLALLAFVKGNPLVTSVFPHKDPVTRKEFPCNDVIMIVCDCRHHLGVGGKS